MKILVTGGTGYIGSHTCIELLAAGHEVVVIDNLTNSNIRVLNRLHKITGQAIEFAQIDIRDTEELSSLFRAHQFDAVIHFAGLKAVGESTQEPLKYYDNNVNGTQVLARVMIEHGVNNLVFSSSATVYGDAKKMPITESSDTTAVNPYGRTKLVVEHMLTDLAAAQAGLSITLLRYFNPVGAHSSGLIGEDPRDTPNNLMPFVSQVAVGKRDQLQIFGSDYPTHDGTGVRDYIHVMDLANGHVKAIERHAEDAGVHIYNLGTGKGYSVLDIVHAFREENQVDIPYHLADRRPGDVAICYADAAKAKSELNWQCSRTLSDMVKDTWRWQSMNPNGYQEQSYD